MPIFLRIALLYGTPALAVAAAVACFGALLLGVRRGRIGRRPAIARMSLTLLLPLIALVIVWLASEWSSYVSVGGADGFRPSPELLLALLPLAGYVAIPVVALNIAFWIAARPGNRGPRSDA